VLLENKHVYAPVRTDKENRDEKVITLVNVSNEEQTITLSAAKYELNGQTYTDLITKKRDRHYRRSAVREITAL
jgi:hypothetical protein